MPRPRKPHVRTHERVVRNLHAVRRALRALESLGQRLDVEVVAEAQHAQVMLDRALSLLPKYVSRGVWHKMWLEASAAIDRE